MKLKLFSVFLTSYILLSCGEGTKQNAPARKEQDSTSASLEPQSALSYEPGLQRADSLQILFYDNPDGDSLRYNRFFHYTATADSAVINALLANLREPVALLNSVKQCRSEGKIYVFDGEESLKTVYFSTRCDSCCYLYYIKEGLFYYSPLTFAFKRQLEEKKRIRVAP